MTGAGPRFSVVIPTWNRATLVSRALDSVLSQTYDDIEVIVVDDGSTDDTEAVVAGIDDRRVRYIAQGNLGESAARNTGARAALGRYLAFLDSDDEVLPRWLEALHAELAKSRAEVAVCGREIVDLEGGSTSSWVPGTNIDLDDLVMHFEAGIVAMGRGVFLASGGYATAIRYGQHTELAIRLFCGDSPPKLAVVPQPLVLVHRPPGDRGYGSARADSARYVLQHHAACRRQVPHLWGSYNTIVGVDLARQGALPAGRRHFLAAFRSEPSQWRHLARLAAASAGPVARRVWPLPQQNQRDMPTMPSLLFVAIAPGLGGSMRSLATVLGQMGNVHRAVACPVGTTFTDFLNQRSLCDEIVTLPAARRSRLVARVRAAAAVSIWACRHRRSIKAIHANGLAERNLVTLAAFLTRAPIVVWMHEWSVSPWARRLSPVLRILVPDTRFAAVSEQARDTLVEAGLARRDEIAIVPNPIDPADVRAEHRVPHARLTIAFLGTPARYKGFHLLPGIIRALSGEAVTWLIHAGPRTMLPDVWSELDAIRDIEIEMPGKLADVRLAYGRCDIVVCPSLQESFGRVAAEAMCNGLPVVASDLPALRDLIGQGDAGLLVPAGDIEAAAAAIRLLLFDADLRRRLGEAGRKRACAFEPNHIIAGLVGLYGGQG